MNYTTHQIAGILNAAVHPKATPGLTVSQLLIDSRQIAFPDSGIFFALPGKRHDGHRFIGQAYAAGVRAFVISQDVSIENYPEACFLKVPHTLDAFQKLAAYHRQQFQLPVIGITGSNGKTIVKEWLFQLLGDDYRIVRSPRSYNSQVGVPLSVWQLGPQHELGIFEAGISQTGEMERLAPIIRCDIGLITNIGDAHSEGFSDTEEKVREKLRLFAFAKKIIYCRDHELIHRAITGLPNETFTWSRERAADLQVTSVASGSSGNTQLSGIYAGNPVDINIPFGSAASIENAIHCWAVLLYLKVDPVIIKRRMARLEPIAMRLELREGINGCTIINDSYNSDLTSLSIALRFAGQQGQGHPLTLILSDILQSGEAPEVLYQRVGRLLHEHRVDRLIGIGTAIGHLNNYLPKGLKAGFYSSTEGFLQALPNLTFKHETILLKGARYFAFEKIARFLSRKTHRTVLEVDLSAIAHNLRVYHRRLEPATKMMAMVKAAAYGSGSGEVARLLEFHGVDYLAVAYADEGADLRRAGITLPILVLNPEEAAFDQLIRYRLEPEVYSLPQLRQFIDATAGLEENIPIHLKIESGMHRLGFETDSINQLIALLIANPHLKVRSVFSHLSAGENPDHDEFTHRQARTFQDTYEWIAGGIGYRPMRHILNSSGIARFPQYQMEMVRLGIGLYGLESDAELAVQLKPVLSLKAVVSQIKPVAAHESVGYGRRAQAGHDRRIATLSIGYADGLPRAAGNGNYAVLINGHPSPLIGHVCMDMCMADVTEIPSVSAGDEVLIFGPDLPVTALAQALNTIPYEILTGISPRVKRVYVQE